MKVSHSAYSYWGHGRDGWSRTDSGNRYGGFRSQEVSTVRQTRSSDDADESRRAWKSRETDETRRSRETDDDDKRKTRASRDADESRRTEHLEGSRRRRRSNWAVAVSPQFAEQLSKVSKRGDDNAVKVIEAKAEPAKAKTDRDLVVKVVREEVEKPDAKPAKPVETKTDPVVDVAKPDPKPADKPAAEKPADSKPADNKPAAADKGKPSDLSSTKVVLDKIEELKLELTALAEAREAKDTEQASAGTDAASLKISLDDQQNLMAFFMAFMSMQSMFANQSSMSSPQAALAQSQMAIQNAISAYNSISEG